MKKTIFMGLIIGAIATVIVASSTIPAAYATIIPKKDPGASGLTPKEEPQIPGWDPNGAEEDAPGQEAGIPVPQPPVPQPPEEIPPMPCHNCAQEFSPGQEGLKAGIIGPDLKCNPHEDEDC